MLAFRIYKPHDLIIPGGLFKLLENLAIMARPAVVANRKWHEVGINRVDNYRVRKGFFAIRYASAASGDFLEKDQNEFAALLRDFDSLIVITQPRHFAQFRMSGPRGTY